jgi:hypothetical protein
MYIYVDVVEWSRALACIYTNVSLKIKPNSVRIRFLSCQIFVLPSTGFVYVGVVEWSRALDVRLSEWCCSVSMVWVQIPSREEQKFDKHENVSTKML